MLTNKLCRRGFSSIRTAVLIPLACVKNRKIHQKMREVTLHRKTLSHRFYAQKLPLLLLSKHFHQKLEKHSEIIRWIYPSATFLLNVEFVFGQKSLKGKTFARRIKSWNVQHDLRLTLYLLMVRKARNKTSFSS